MSCGYVSDIADGLTWAAGLSVTGVPANANPALVINVSLGGSGSCSSTWQNAIDAVTAVCTTVVVVAGNNNIDASGFSPANYGRDYGSIDRAHRKARV